VSYREFAPPAALAPWLECLWERRADGRPVRVIPDGCIDVVWLEHADTYVVGANTTAFLSEPQSSSRVVGARLRPGAAPALLGIAGEAVRDARIPLRAFWREQGARLAAALDRDPDPVHGLLGALRERAHAAPTPDPLVTEVVARVRNPRVPITDLGRELAVSERQLRRRVSAAVGYGPRRLARVLRLQRALDAARAGDELARVAAEAGFADQAHFTNDCRELAGIPPSALIAA
jgi:AraC-like DNA-binding protein